MNKSTVLILEDESSVLEPLKKKCEIEGYKVFTASNGEDGLTIALKQHPDLILLDIIMPKMDGLGFVKELHKDEWGKQASIIVLTNLSNSQILIEVQKEGIRDYFIKATWKLEELMKVIANKLEIQTQQPNTS